MSKVRQIRVGRVHVGGGFPLVLIAGPCVIESRRQCLELAGRLARWADAEQVPFIFKASYDKANRSAHDSFRGPGLTRGLDILAEIKERFRVPVLTDVHHETEVPAAAKVADLLQCPAFLCRQTDLILALGHSGLPVNIKKGQFLAPPDILNILRKFVSTGNRKLMITERGASFGYNNLVADMRSLPIMRELGYPVVFDATHSVQLPGGAGNRSGGEAWLAPCLARAAVAAGCDAVFVETHLRPGQALSDKDTQMSLEQLKKMWHLLRRIDRLVRQEKALARAGRSK